MEAVLPNALLFYYLEETKLKLLKSHTLWLMARQFETLVQGCRKLLSPTVQVKQFSHSKIKNKFTNVCGFVKFCM